MGVLLAKVFDPEKHDPTGWWMSEKLDGVRAIWNGETFESRTGKPFFAPLNWTSALPKDIRLDGELFMGRGKFQQTVGAVRKKVPDHRWNDVSYLVFDLPDSPRKFEARYEALCYLGRTYPFETVHHLACKSRQHLQDFYDTLVSAGAEGVMLREPGSLYVAKRSGTLLKMKGSKDGIAVIVGHQPGEGKHVGRLGALECIDVESGLQFKVGTGFSDAEREDAPPVGSTIRYAYQELTQAGKPRFPVYLCRDEGD